MRHLLTSIPDGKLTDESHGIRQRFSYYLVALMKLHGLAGFTEIQATHRR